MSNVEYAPAPTVNNLNDAPSFRLFFPEAHGAAGNNTGDDSTAINAAIAAAHSAGGGTVSLTGVYRCLNSVSLSGRKNVTLDGDSFARPFGPTLNWAGADSTSAAVCDTGEGITVRGIQFFALSATFTAALLDFRGSGAGSYHVAVERNMFSGQGALHSCIETGVGNTYEIRKNDFYRCNIAINGQTSIPVASSVQTCLVQQNFFSSQVATAHITNPGAGWEIDNNSVEPLSSGVAGFVKLTGSYTLTSVAITNNWCGDVSLSAASGEQIQIAGGPVTIRGNTLGGGAAGSAGIRCVGPLNGGQSNGVDISGGNRFTAGSGATFVDWGSFTHTASVYEFGNMNVAGSSVQYAGTRPPNLVTDSDLRGKNLNYVTVDATAVVNPDPLLGDYWFYLNGNNIGTMNLPNGDRIGRRITVWIQQNGTGTNTVTWPATVSFKGAAPTLTGAFAFTAVTLMWGGATLNNKWYEVTRNG